MSSHEVEWPVGKSPYAPLTMTCIRTPCWHREVFWKSTAINLGPIIEMESASITMMAAHWVAGRGTR